MTVTREGYLRWHSKELKSAATEASGEELANMVNTKLAEVIGDRELLCFTADHKDHEDLIKEIMKANIRGPMTVRFYDAFADPFMHGGSDSIYFFIMSPNATDDEFDIIFDLMNNYGADPPEPVIIKCPKCNATIERLNSALPASVPVFIDAAGDIEFVDGLDTEDYVTDYESVGWFCPECGRMLFSGDDAFDKAVKFLQGKNTETDSVKSSEKEDRPVQPTKRIIIKDKDGNVLLDEDADPLIRNYWAAWRDDERSELPDEIIVEAV